MRGGEEGGKRLRSWREDKKERHRGRREKKRMCVRVRQRDRVHRARLPARGDR